MRGFGLRNVSSTQAVLVTPEDKMRIEVLARAAGAHSASEYLRTIILRALDAEQRRLNITANDFEKYRAMVEETKAKDRRGRFPRRKSPSE